MSKYALGFVLLAAAVAAQAQQFRVQVDASDMVPLVDVFATSIANVVTARLVNREDFDVQCSVEFNTGPEQRTRRVRVAAGKEAVATYSVTRPGSTQRVRVRAVCDIADAGDE